MALALRDLDRGLVDLIVGTARRVDELARMPSGPKSIGIRHLAPYTKAGTPSDDDFAPGGQSAALGWTPLAIGSTEPDRIPVGCTCVDTVANKWWVRTAGVTRGAVAVPPPPSGLGPVTGAGTWRACLLLT
jgi:hypothetical protein